MPHPRFPCPCCGYVVFADLPGGHGTCPVCGWVDDIVQLRWPAHADGANCSSLWQAQRAFASVSDEAVAPRRIGNDRPRREFGWRALDPSIDALALSRPSRPAGAEGWPRDVTTLYYWRPAKQRRESSRRRAAATSA